MAERNREGQERSSSPAATPRPVKLGAPRRSDCSAHQTRSQLGLPAGVLLASIVLLLVSLQAFALTTAQEITQEATAPNSETNHPLPLVGSWAAGTQWDGSSTNLGYTPTWQLQMI